MRRKLEAARKLYNKNKSKDKREQNDLPMTLDSNCNVVKMDKQLGHVSTNDQDQNNVQEIVNERFNTENTIILVSNTQIETEPNIARADQTVDFKRDDFGGDEIRRSRSIKEEEYE